MFPPVRYVVGGWQHERCLTKGVWWWDWGKCRGGLIETPKSLGAVIKMAPRFGDEKVCLALWVHWRCSPAYLERPLFMSFYKFQLTFLSVVDVSFCLGYTGCVLSPNKMKILVKYIWYYNLGAGFLLRLHVCLLFDSGLRVDKGRVIFQTVTY